MKAIDKLRAALAGGQRPDWADAAARQRLADFMVDYRRLCADVGPWEYAANLGAPADADLRQIAYQAVWRDGPTLEVWAYVQRFDAIDLLIDAAVEGFEEYVAAHASA